jgi:hypothetical protein
MARGKRAKWNVGDLFLVPQSDAFSSLGQVLSYEASALNSVLCAFYDIRFTARGPEELPEELLEGDLISIQFTTRDLLDSGVWKVVGHRKPANLRMFPQLESLRACGFVGAEVTGSGIILKFLDAYYGLHPWDAWYEPDYLDKLLIHPDRKPKNLVLRQKEEREKGSGSM